MTFQDSGGGLGVALNTGVLVVAFGRNAAAKADDAFDFSGDGLQMLKGAAELVYSGPCAGAATEANKISLMADGSRMIVTCSGGGARMVRLREKPASRLAGVGPVARFGGALVRLGGTGEHKWFEVLDVSGKVSEHSDTTGEAIKYWVAAENGSAALSVGSSGTVRSWRPGAPGLVTYGVQLADIRAARFAPDGSRAALLDKNGVFARIRIGEATPEFVGRLGGPVVPAIDFSIDRTLSHVAFTTADRNVADEATDPRPQVDNSFAVVATPGKDEAQFGCRHVESSHYAAALFSDSTGPTVIYLVRRDRVVEKLVLNRGTSDATGLTPCPAGLLDAPPGLKWEINPFTHESVRVVEAAGADRADRLVFGGASDNPLELIDLASQRPITDLTPISGGNRALVLSADGRYLAALGDTARTIDIFDITTGSLLCRVRTEQAVANDRKAVLFARDNQVLLVRLMSGITIAYVIALRDGEDLLEQVKSVGIGPVTDDERREIYDIRRRFSRPTAYGALSLVPSPRA